MARENTFSSTSAEELIELARQAMRGGHRQRAQRYLHQAARLEPDNFMVWLWLASAAPQAEASQDYIERAAQLNPNDPRVHEAQVWVEKRFQAENGPHNADLPDLEPADKKKRKVPTAVIAGSLLVTFIIFAALTVFILLSNN